MLRLACLIDRYGRVNESSFHVLLASFFSVEEIYLKNDELLLLCWCGGLCGGWYVFSIKIYLQTVNIARGSDTRFSLDYTSLGGHVNSNLYLTSYNGVTLHVRKLSNPGVFVLFFF